jgi:hypothetical protein
MWLRSNGEPLLNFQVKQYLIGIELVAERPERRPLQPFLGWRTKISFENQMPIPRRNAKIILVRIKQFNAVLRAF